MKKSDLKDGMVVKIEGYFDENFNGLKLVSGRFFFDMVGFELNENFNENMINARFSGVKITEVYEIVGTYPLEIILNSGTGLRLVWKMEKEIDWSKVPFGTDVIVSDCLEKHNSSDGFNRIFVGYEPKLKNYPFIVASAIVCEATSYRYCKIHPSVEIKEEWYK